MTRWEKSLKGLKHVEAGLSPCSHVLLSMVSLVGASGPGVTGSGSTRALRPGLCASSGMCGSVPAWKDA